MNKKLARRSSLFLLPLIILLIPFCYTLFPAPITQSEGIVYDLRPGMTRAAFVSTLAEQGIIRYPWLFASYAYLHPFATLKTGEYHFPRGITPYRIWYYVTRGTGYHYRAVTIVPGWSFTTLRQALATAEGMTHLTTTMASEEVMKALGHPELKPEGEFFPETYYYLRGESDLSILSRAYHLMQKHLQAVWLSRSASLPYQDPYSLLIAASLVEKEAHLDEERPLIAGVLVNRLNKHMLLQMDPTVIYSMGERYAGSIHKKDLKEKNPYNTYVYKGLPPTPIAIPSLASLLAVANPDEHHYYYFVAKGDGSHVFSESLTAHHYAIKQNMQHKVRITH